MSTQIDIISGFLGAGKTTFLKKIIPHMQGKIALIENEFGDIGVDGDLIQDKLPIKEIYAGCICCSLASDFKKAIEELTLEYRPNHILIEPSGVGSLSDIIKVCRQVCKSSGLEIKINRLITIVDVSAFEDYVENFGGFYLDQIQNARIIFLSHLDKINPKEAEKVISKIKLYNQAAFIFKEQWYSYEGKEIIEILKTIDDHEAYSEKVPVLMTANKVFSTVSVKNPRVFCTKEMDQLAISLKNLEYGFVLRAKGMLKLDTGQFAYFDFTPHHNHWEYTEGCNEAKIAFIGSDLKNKKILEWFHE